MDEKDLKCISASVSAGQLRELCDRLYYEEEMIYALCVGLIKDGYSKIEIYCDAKDSAYFKNMLDHEI